MLEEVPKATLGTVTERLQQILRTRCAATPPSAEVTQVDVNALLRETQACTWAEMGRDKWKVAIAADVPPGPAPVTGDLSHLQQAIENLLFNARDATFEMRNYLRDEAKRETEPAARRQKLLDAAAWKGEVHLAARRDGAHIVLEVRDNGIGMTEEVRRNCAKAHFTTKRDNALYEGYSAPEMGLGLSFVAMVMEHHGPRHWKSTPLPLRGNDPSDSAFPSRPDEAVKSVISQTAARWTQILKDKGRMATKEHKGHKRKPRQKNRAFELNSIFSSVFFCAFCAFLWPSCLCLQICVHSPRQSRGYTLQRGQE